MAVAEPLNLVSPSWGLLLCPISLVLWMLDSIAGIFAQVGRRMSPSKPYSSDASLDETTLGKTEMSGERRRHSSVVGQKLQTTIPRLGNVSTLAELADWAFNEYAENNFGGTRQFLGMDEMTKLFGNTSWITYAATKERVDHLAFGLKALGCRPSSNVHEGSRPPHYPDLTTFVIFEDTCLEWVTFFLACMMQSVTIATAYSTLGFVGVRNILNETEAEGLLINAKNLDKVQELVSQCPTLRTVVVSGYQYLEPLQMPEIPGVRLISYDDLLALGASAPVKQMNKPKPDHLAIIMYTSGSTNKPKGVLLRHAEMVATVSACYSRLHDGGVLAGSGSVYLAHAPLAHVMEMTLELATISMGGGLGFSDPKSMASRLSAHVDPTTGERTPWGGIQEFRPHLFPGVPKIFEIVKRGIMEQITTESAVVQYIFKVAYFGKRSASRRGWTSPLFDALVFNKIKARFGGRVIMALSGGGPLSPSTHEFIRVATGLNLIQGYGSTECCGMVSVQDWTARVIPFSNVGALITSVECRLVPALNSEGIPITDREGRPYSPKDTFHLGVPCLGRGEICVRGSNVTKGYFKDPQNTVAVFTEDGWYHMGDVGVWQPDGSLALVDRVKNLVKLRTGEYIALEQMEAIYSQSKYINPLTGGIVCHGDGDMDRPIAFAQVVDAQILDLARSLDIPGNDVSKLIHDPQIVQGVLADLLTLGKTGLNTNELLGTLRLFTGTGDPNSLNKDSPWTPENGGLTASNKLDRRAILSAFPQELHDTKSLLGVYQPAAALKA